MFVLAFAFPSGEGIKRWGSLSFSGFGGLHGLPHPRPIGPDPSDHAGGMIRRADPEGEG